MSTFDWEELSKGYKPSNFYEPPKVDTDQWIKTAIDAGMKYAILTTRHWLAMPPEQTYDCQLVEKLH